MARPKAHELSMVCNHCKYVYTDEEAETTLGIKRVPMSIDGVMMDTFENLGEVWKKFPSCYCLKLFDTYEKRIEHDRLYHKIGDPMATCIPNGVIEIESNCGNVL